MEEKLTGLRDEVQRHSTPSLHSIHSEDLVCLKKIHQLAEEEFKLKNCIEELKSKETTYRRQMKQLLSCKKFRRDCERETERAQKPEGKGKRFYPENTYRYNSTEREYAFKDTEKVSRKNSRVLFSLPLRHFTRILLFCFRKPVARVQYRYRWPLASYHRRSRLTRISRSRAKSFIYRPRVALRWTVAKPRVKSLLQVANLANRPPLLHQNSSPLARPSSHVNFRLAPQKQVRIYDIEMLCAIRQNYRDIFSCIIILTYRNT